MSILARKRGLGRLVVWFFGAVYAGQPWAIGLLLAIVAGVVGYFVYAAKTKEAGGAEEQGSAE